MEKAVAQEYSTRVAQANRSELVVIIYEIVGKELEIALESYQKEDLEQFEKALKSAQKFLNELMGTLDYSYAISYDLMAMYLVVNKSIITSIMKKEPKGLDSARNIMKQLQIGFEGVSEQDTSAPLMANTQKLYAGLTYGKGMLNEISINVNDSYRGFQA